MRGVLSPPNPTPSKPVGGEVVYVSAPNPSLRRGLSRNAGLHHAGQAEIRMVEDIKKLTLKTQLHMLAQGKPLCQVEIAPEKIRTAQGIASEVSELAILRTVAAIAGSGGHGFRLPVDFNCLRARIDGRTKASGLSHCSVPGCVTPGIG
jgi:hypothetical protein